MPPARRARDALRLVLVEPQPAQRATHPDGRRVSGPDLPAPGELGDGPVVVLANELLDNLPFRLLERADGGVARGARSPSTATAGRGAVADLPPADAERLPAGSLPGARRGARIPLQDRAAAWLAGAPRSHRAGGRVVVFDYASPTTAELADAPVDRLAAHLRGHGAAATAWTTRARRTSRARSAVDQLAGRRG